MRTCRLVGSAAEHTADSPANPSLGPTMLSSICDGDKRVESPAVATTAPFGGTEALSETSSATPTPIPLVPSAGLGCAVGAAWPNLLDGGLDAAAADGAEMVDTAGVPIEAEAPESAGPPTLGPSARSDNAPPPSCGACVGTVPDAAAEGELATGVGVGAGRSSASFVGLAVAALAAELAMRGDGVGAQLLRAPGTSLRLMTMRRVGGAAIAAEEDAVLIEASSPELSAPFFGDVGSAFGGAPAGAAVARAALGEATDFETTTNTFGGASFVSLTGAAGFARGGTPSPPPLACRNSHCGSVLLALLWATEAVASLARGLDTTT